jgi:SAM-dependent methyltransferase
MVELSVEERERRLAQELLQWESDQYGGDNNKRRSVHSDRWREFFTMLDLDPQTLPHPQHRSNTACVVGCNLGGFEWDVLEAYPDLRVDACDLIAPNSEPPLWRETRERFGDRIRYFSSTDLQVSLPDPPYDLIVVMAVLHHCPDPGAAATVLLDSLVPGGLVLVAEYVGKPGLSASDERYRVADTLWQALPEAYKRRKDGTLQEHPYRPIAGETEGFESIASDQILPAVRPRFEIVAERFMSALLGYRLIIWEEGALPQVNPDLERLLWAVERLCLSEGWLSGEDWYAVLRKPV